jgi:glycosyltransferase involved in cell wall biosynthesis
LRVIQIVTQAEAGGAQAVANILGEGLLARGHKSEVWFLYRKRNGCEKRPGTRVLFPEPPKGLDYFKIIWRLFWALLEYKPEAVITHTHYANVLGQAIATLTGVSIRIAVHHNPLETYPKFVRLMDRLAVRADFYTTMVAVSFTVLESARDCSAHYRALMKVIYNGVPTASSSRAAKEVRDSFNIPRDVQLLLNVGRLAIQKNQGFLLQVLTYLPDTHLALAGDGELNEELRKKCEQLQVSERVHFLGEQPNSEIVSLLGAADVFVFPSLFEGMPLVLLEAMYIGIPIVASDIPAHREILGESGIVLAIQPEYFGSVIAKLQHDRQRCESLSEGARVRVKQFTTKRMVEYYECLLTGK